MAAKGRRRLDVELVRRGLASGRDAARRLVEERVVTVNGAVAERVARMVSPADALEVRRPARFVSRGGEKLDGALAQLALDVAGRRCIDVGASTGGFTDCLLQRGAAHVVALDVGRNQLHERLRASPAVQSVEGVNVRHVTSGASAAADDGATPRGGGADVRHVLPGASVAAVGGAAPRAGGADVRHVTSGDLGGPAGLVVADLSFISLRVVMAQLAALVSPGGDLLALVKPQFEAGRQEASAGRGVIRSPEVWRRVLTEVAQAAREAGLAPRTVLLADPPGAQGNAEFFLHCTNPLAGGGGRAADEAGAAACKGGGEAATGAGGAAGAGARGVDAAGGGAETGAGGGAGENESGGVDAGEAGAAAGKGGGEAAAGKGGAAGACGDGVDAGGGGFEASLAGAVRAAGERGLA